MSALSATSNLPASLSRQHNAILTVAHRGVWSLAPENSIGAVEAAVALGVEIVELDTQSTADGSLVLMHDESLDRTTNGAGAVKAATRGELSRLLLREGAGGPAAKLSSEGVPLLAEALETARDRVLVNVDTKHRCDLAPVVSLIRDMGMLDQVIMKTEVDPVASRQLVEDLDILGKVVHMPIMQVRPGKFVDDLRAISRLRPPILEVAFSRISDLEAGREELERLGIRLWINTIDVSHNLHFSDTNALADPDSVWGELLDAGVDTFQTDHCEAFKAYLAQRSGSASRS